MSSSKEDARDQFPRDRYALGVLRLEKATTTEIQDNDPLGVVLCAYAVSFLLPATYLRTDRDLIYGYEAFYLGLSWPLVWPMWLANPVFWLGCCYFAAGRWKKAAILGLVAVLLGISEFLFFDNGAVRIGYFLWLTAMLLLTLSGVFVASFDRLHQGSQFSDLFGELRGEVRLCLETADALRGAIELSTDYSSTCKKLKDHQLGVIVTIRSFNCQAVGGEAT